MQATMRSTVTVAAAWLAGCAQLLGPTLAVGQREADVLAQLGAPTARYAMAQGVTRLEFATGPFGRHTWMVDVDPQGRVVRHDQVLDERHFFEFQQKAPGMALDELLRTLGTPGERRSGGRQGGEVWTYRYPTNDCLWFQVSIGDDRRVVAGAYGIDWRCDARQDGRAL